MNIDIHNIKIMEIKTEAKYGAIQDIAINEAVLLALTHNCNVSMIHSKTTYFVNLEKLSDLVDVKNEP